MKIFSLILLLVLSLSFSSAIIVNADYITTYPGQEGKVSIEIENNENFDIEEVSLRLDLSDTDFTTISGSEKDYEDIDEDDSESESFTIKPATGITPGDYDIPYIVKYTNSDNTSETHVQNGSFGIRVSAKTDLDFAAETNENPVVGEKGRITIEVINRGLGEIKSVSVELLPNGFEILSKNKEFVGSIDADDSDTASFDVMYKSRDPSFSAIITYKDFDNKDQSTTENFIVPVYTREEALEAGIIKKTSYTLYIVIAVLIIVFIIYRRIRKKRRLKNLNK